MLQTFVFSTQSYENYANENSQDKEEEEEYDPWGADSNDGNNDEEMRLGSNEPPDDINKKLMSSIEDLSERKSSIRFQHMLLNEEYTKETLDILKNYENYCHENILHLLAESQFNETLDTLLKKMLEYYSEKELMNMILKESKENKSPWKIAKTLRNFSGLELFVGSLKALISKKKRKRRCSNCYVYFQEDNKKICECCEQIKIFGMLTNELKKTARDAVIEMNKMSKIINSHILEKISFKKLYDNIEENKPETLMMSVSEDLHTLLHWNVLGIGTNIDGIIPPLLHRIQSDFPNEIIPYIKKFNKRGNAAIHEAAEHGRIKHLDELLHYVKLYYPENLLEVLMQRNRSEESSEYGGHTLLSIGARRESLELMQTIINLRPISRFGIRLFTQKDVHGRNIMENIMISIISNHSVQEKHKNWINIEKYFEHLIMLNFFYDETQNLKYKNETEIELFEYANLWKIFSNGPRNIILSYLILNVDKEIDELTRNCEKVYEEIQDNSELL